MEKKQPEDIGILSKRRVAELYGISTKTLKRRLAKLGFKVTNNRFFFPKEILAIIVLLGHWSTHYEEP